MAENLRITLCEALLPVAGPPQDRLNATSLGRHK